MIVGFETAYGENSANKTLPEVPETRRHAVAIRNPTQMFFSINCVSKLIVLFSNEIWLREKTKLLLLFSQLSIG